MSHCESQSANPHVVAVSISSGGIPKHPMLAGLLAKVGFVGDGHSHARHIREDRAVSLLDYEILWRLEHDGFPLVPGAVGENLTVAGLSVQQMHPGTLLQIGRAVLKLKQPRQPGNALNAIDPRLQSAIRGSCGYLASVVREGWIRPGMRIEVVTNDLTAELPSLRDDGIEWGVARTALAQLLDV